ncbi:MAG: HU family DNA-binding protein [Paludibacteraceae bacterium]|nr:HU family DNA-binding protein [Paludibacteraceae bacterium]
MADKKSILELSERIAQESGVSKEEVDRFLRSFVKELSEGILSDGQVKVRGIGTFKIQWNEPRKSVDVRTGAETIIAGHNKLVYAADGDMKEQVNDIAPKVIATTERKIETENVDPAQRLHEQATEISMLLKGLEGEPSKSEENETVAVAANEQVEPIVSDSTSSDEKVQEGSLVGAYDMGDRELPVEGSRRGYKVVEWLLIVLFIIALIGVLVYIERSNHIFSDFAKNEYAALKEWNENRKAENAKQEAIDAAKEEQDRLSKLSQERADSVGDVVGDSVINAQKAEEQEETVDSGTVVASTNGEKWSSAAEQVSALSQSMKQIKEDSEKKKEEAAKRKRLEKQGLIGQEKLTKGKHLTDLALTYYGHKDFWIYIYEANKDRMPNPNDIKIGTMVNIPKVDETDVDATNPQALEKAREKIRQLGK